MRCGSTESGFIGVDEGYPYRELILNRFQEGLGEVTNTEHLPGGAVRECQWKDQATNPEVSSPDTSGRIGMNAQDHIGV